MKVKIQLLVSAIALASCATMKSTIRTIDDLASAACMIFGQENPREFAYLVEQTLPPNLMQQANQNGFSPKVLCKVKEVLQPFIDDQLRIQQQTAAGLRAGMRRNDATSSEQ